uniref:Uncharacterized protein n=1 Tax=viral metagenome TaxID=1070528 RepID=A0A6H1ZRS5_9ZZZZ
MYILNYNPSDGKVGSIQRDNMSIPICEANSDYQAFLRWNAEQDTPLDLDSTIPVVKPEPARDLLAEIEIMKVDIVKLKDGKVDK